MAVVKGQTVLTVPHWQTLTVTWSQWQSCELTVDDSEATQTPNSNEFSIFQLS